MNQKVNSPAFSCLSEKQVDLYIFGSSVFSEEPNDIDFAIIYNKANVSIEEAIACRNMLREEAENKYPYRADILLLSVEEECEAQFLANAKHIKIG